MLAGASGLSSAALPALPVSIPGADFQTGCQIPTGGLVVYAEDPDGRWAGYRLNLDDPRRIGHVTLVLE